MANYGIGATFVDAEAERGEREPERWELMFSRTVPDDIVWRPVRTVQAPLDLAHAEVLAIALADCYNPLGWPDRPADGRGSPDRRP